MKVVLINPPITPEERYGTIFKEGGGKQAPLGICYIAAVLRENNIPVSIIDAEAENLSYEEIIKRLKECNFVGITSTTVAFHRALELAKRIKKYNKKIFIAIGGPHISAMPKMTIKLNAFDVGVIGEGEYTTLELIQKLSNKKSYEKIDGIIFRKKGKIVRTKPRKLIENLDELPFPARDLLLDKNLYNPPPMNYLKKPVLSIITSRGCPNQCTFCDHMVFGYKFRGHSAKRIIEEIKMLIREYDAKEVSIVDDTFTVNKERVFEFCRLLKENNIKIPWNARISENTTTKEMLKTMKDAGCWYIEIGIETGSPRVLKDIKKGTTLERIRDLVEYAAKIGFVIKGFFMIGHPTDTKESIEKTIKFAKELPITDIVATIFAPFPNTEAYIQSQKEGNFIHDREWSKFNAWQVVFVPKNLTEEHLLYSLKRIYKEFYFRPIIMLRHLKQIKNLSAIKRYIRGAKVLLKTLI